MLVLQFIPQPERAVREMRRVTRPGATVAELRELWSCWGVLVFRRQALSEAELAAFCALLGPLERTVRSDWASPAVPEKPW